MLLQKAKYPNGVLATVLSSDVQTENIDFAVPVLEELVKEFKSMDDNTTSETPM